MNQDFESVWPYLNQDIAPIPMTMKVFPEDFYVEEIPAYQPGGKGQHLYLWIEKKGVATHEAVRQIAKAAGVSRKQIGVAGLKDARAVTRQFLSIDDWKLEAIDPSRLHNIRILSMARHNNKLKAGHLKGNRFRLKLRNVDEARWEDFRRMLDFIAHKGVPNYFGAQRFGMRGDTWKIGRAILENNERLAAGLIAGLPEEGDQGGILKARQLFDQGEYEEAAKVWPRQFNHCVTLCRALAMNGGNFRKALYQLDRKILRFYVSAFQSWIFNTMLAKRIHELDTVKKGDWAYKHVNGAVFLVQDEAGDAERARQFEISATGPLHGKKMRRPEGYPAQLEREVLAAAEVPETVFTDHFLRCTGDRRPLRIKPLDIAAEKGTDEHGFYFLLDLTLPAGCYATVVLREIAREGLVDAGERPRAEKQESGNEEESGEIEEEAEETAETTEPDAP